MHEKASERRWHSSETVMVAAAIRIPVGRQVTRRYIHTVDTYCH